MVSELRGLRRGRREADDELVGDQLQKEVCQIEHAGWIYSVLPRCKDSIISSKPSLVKTISAGCRLSPSYNCDDTC
jgi:hypothetical protein